RAALDLAVAEQVGNGKQSLTEELEAALVVATTQVVPVGEVEEVQVPVLRRVLTFGDLGSERIGARDPGAPRLASREEGVAVDLLRLRIVDDVPAHHAVVVAANPVVDPEGFDPHDL